MATDPGMLSSWYSDYLKSQPTTSTVTPAQATTTDWTPDAKSTVAGQIADITAKGSPLMDQAETAAKQQMNKRGLLNSSMAITAGQDAVYRTALPIAQQDANTFANAGQFNAGAKNQTSQFNAGMLDTANRFNATATNEATAQQRAAGVQGGLQQQASDNRLREMTAATDEQLRMLDAQNGTKIADSYRTASQSTYDNYIADVQRIQESDMDPDVKAAQVANLQGLYQTRQEFINTIYRYSPAWSEDWAQFAVEFGEGTGG